jgi:hypothetical protein
MLAVAARKLEPPRPQSRRWPKALAGMALLAALGAVATVMTMRKNARMMRSMPPPPMPPETPSRTTTEPQSGVLNSKSEPERRKTEAEVNGLSRTR